MPSPITSVSHAEPAVPVQPATARSKSNPTAPTDTVQLSAAAQAQSAAIKELSETRAQTGQEANSGDLQAQRLLAKETAAQRTNK